MQPQAEGSETPAAGADIRFRVAYVPGVTPTKWVRVWNERHTNVPLELVRVDEAQQTEIVGQDGGADVVLMRLPIDDPDAFHLISLYEELPFVVLPKEHAFAEAARLSLDDLADETLVADLDYPEDMPEREPGSHYADVVEVVAAGSGYAVLPQSVARLYARKDVAAVPLDGAASTTIALAWPRSRASDEIQTFVGIVRGRTAHSSRDGMSDADREASARKAAGKKESDRKAAEKKAAENNRKRAASKKNAPLGGNRPHKGSAARGRGKGRRR